MKTKIIDFIGELDKTKNSPSMFQCFEFRVCLKSVLRLINNTEFTNENQKEEALKLKKVIYETLDKDFISSKILVESINTVMELLYKFCFNTSDNSIKTVPVPIPIKPRKIINIKSHNYGIKR